MGEPIDEWKAVELLLRLGEIYSDLGPVSVDEETEREQGDTLTVEELQFKLGDLLKIAPEPFNKRIYEISLNLSELYLGYIKNEKLFDRNSELGKELHIVMEEIGDYLKNSWKKLYKMEERVLEVFPPSYFDFRPQIHNINKQYIHFTIVESLQKSILFFDREEYFECINSCGQASEKLTETLMKHCGLPPERNWKRNLDRLQKHYIEKEMKSINLHWFIYFLLCVVHFLRNSHLTDTIGIPKWMDYYQKHMENDQPRWARIALICSLEATEIFQEILENQNSDSIEVL